MEKQEKILIVDDSPSVRDSVKLTLMTAGYDVITSGDGEEALKKIHLEMPDLVLLDIEMPKMDGYQVCRKIREDTLTHNLPVIFLTGREETKDKIEGLNIGSDDYLIKTVDPMEMIARVNTIIRRTKKAIDTNPLTGLPGNLAIMERIKQTIENKSHAIFLYFDIDKFKSFNDYYGFSRGDIVIRNTAHIIMAVKAKMGSPNDFVGHVGGDDFTAIVNPNIVDVFCGQVIKQFDLMAPRLYDEKDRERGYISVEGRIGNINKFPVITISIVGVDSRRIKHIGELSNIFAELKKYAKSKKGSYYFMDKRKE